MRTDETRLLHFYQTQGSEMLPYIGPEEILLFSEVRKPQLGQIVIVEDVRSGLLRARRYYGTHITRSDRSLSIERAWELDYKFRGVVTHRLARCPRTKSLDWVEVGWMLRCHWLYSKMTIWIHHSYHPKIQSWAHWYLNFTMNLVKWCESRWGKTQDIHFQYELQCRYYDFRKNQLSTTTHPSAFDREQEYQSL